MKKIVTAISTSASKGTRKPRMIAATAATSSQHHAERGSGQGIHQRNVFISVFERVTRVSASS
jgi:hypothetical protein